ncbi:hypothetical protein DFJ74DRAFT_290173 [Hyaloraphidium curvatum]|nr:hypothetical protein DFJ74DRAFT_290173 [Hyaloraphidium curvatum]
MDPRTAVEPNPELFLAPPEETAPAEAAIHSVRSAEAAPPANGAATADGATDALFLPYSDDYAFSLTAEQLASVGRPAKTDGGTALLRFSVRAALRAVVGSDDIEGDDDDGHAEEQTLDPERPLEAVSVGEPKANARTVVTEDFKWAPLLAHMELRRIQRLRTGYAVAPDQNTTLFLLLVVIAMLFTLFTLADRFAVLNISQAFSFEIWAWVIMGFVLFPGVLILRFTVPPYVRLSWLWLSCGFIAGLIAWLDASRKLVDLVYPPGPCQDIGGGTVSDQCEAAAEALLDKVLTVIIVMCSLGGALALATIIISLLRNRIYGFFIGRHSNDPAFLTRFFSVRPAPDRKAVFACTFVRPFPLSFKQKRQTFVYTGGVDSAGFASGYGRVNDTGGEVLEGFFEKGLPSAPYVSQERARFSAFDARRVGTCGATGPGDKWSRSGTVRDPAGLFWGVAAVEVSAAGRFFRNLPARKLVLRPCVAPGDFGTHLRATVLPSLRAGIPDSVHGRGGDPGEAIIYVHGLKQSLASACCKLVQLLALTSLPGTKYSLWCFDWPAGSVFTFSKTRMESASEQTELEFGRFLDGLAAAGYRRFHIIGHSMGCRVSTNLARNDGQGLARLFRPCRGVPGAAKDAGKAELASLILINPEILLEDFIANRFPALHRFCPSITVYADKSDRALKIAELIGGEPTLGRNPDLVMDRDAEGRPRYLDVDIVDNTHLVANINSIRHSYFSLNSMLVDDIKSIVEERLLRARDRRTLRSKGGNVFGFLVAPSFAS